MDDVTSDAEALAKAEALPLTKAQKAAPEDTQIPVATQGMASDLDNLASVVSSKITGAIPGIVKAEEIKGKATEEEARGEAEQWDAYQKELRDIYKNSAPTPVNLQAAPKMPDDNPLAQFGSLASMIGIFASAFTKKPIVNALNASADAMKAEQAGNKEAYDLAYQQWKDQSELAFKRHESEIQDLNEIMELAKTDQASALAKLKAWGVVNSSQAATMLSELGDWEEIGKWISSQQTALAKAQESSIKIAELNQKKTEQDRKNQIYQDTLADNLAKGQPRALAETNALMASEAKEGANVLTPEAEDLAATHYLLTGQLPYMGMGSAGGSRQSIMNKAAAQAKEMGITPEDVVAGQASFKADTHSMMQLQKMSDSATSFERTALDNMNTALRLMNKGAGTRFGPVVNRWLQAGRTETGDPDVKAFNAAIVDTMNEMAKILSGSTGAQGATDTAREQTNALLSKIDSPQAVVKTFATLKEMMDSRIKEYNNQRSIIQGRLKTEGQGIKPPEEEKSEKSEEVPPPPEGFQIQ